MASPESLAGPLPENHESMDLATPRSRGGLTRQRAKNLTIIWVVIKSWLDPVTTSRVAILGTDQKKVRERLLADNIPLDAIPACCGGESRDVPLSLVLGSHDSSTVSHLSELITPLNGTSPKEVVVASEVVEKAPVVEEPTTSPRLKAIALAVVAAGAVGGATMLGA